MFAGKLMRILSAAASAAGVVAYFQYRKELDARRAALDSGSTIAETEKGPIEYAETGEGEPFLMVHGAGGGYDQGLLLAEDLGAGYRVIAPSRFGYLKTPVPADSSPAAQADAHAALLDFLQVQRAVVAGASAGAPSVIELALRHPERVAALILLVPRTYHPDQSAHADESAESQFVLQLIQSAADFPFWLATRLSRRSVVRFLGVPPEVEAGASIKDRERVTKVINSITPLSSRVRGIMVDSGAKIAPWPLEEISCPVLIISAEDDLFKTAPGARFTAERINGAELHVLKSGGHLMVGQSVKVRKLMRAFLDGQRKRAAKREAGHPKELEPA